MKSIDRDKVKKSLLKLYKKINNVSFEQKHITILYIISKVFYDDYDGRVFIIKICEKIMHFPENIKYIDWYKEGISLMLKNIDNYKTNDYELIILRDKITDENYMGSKRIWRHATREKYKNIYLDILFQAIRYYLNKKDDGGDINYYLKYDCGYWILQNYTTSHKIYNKNLRYRFDYQSKIRILEILNYWSNYYFELNIEDLIKNA